MKTYSRRKRRVRNNIEKKGRKGKRIRSEKKQGYSRFPTGRKYMTKVGKITNRMFFSGNYSKYKSEVKEGQGII